MNQQKNEFLKRHTEQQTSADFSKSPFDMVIYNDRTEIPHETVDLVARIEKQIATLQDMHLRKKFLMKEITNLRSR